jgi:hypothetical protein
MSHTPISWEVEFTEEFETWWSGLTEAQQIAVDAAVRLLEARGPTLDHPHSSDIRGSRHARMRELRVQCRGRPLRVLYAFDPRRVAILLIGGDKTGDGRWYERMVPVADRIYDEYLAALQEEGLIDGSQSRTQIRGAARSALPRRSRAVEGIGRLDAA